jgi:hypothetical protein
LEQQSWGKAQGQIERLKLEIESNPRLDSVFSICEKLKIDDPIHWMNNTRPIVIDWWIAYLTLNAEREQAAYEKSGGKNGKELDPSSALEKLNKMAM